MMWMPVVNALTGPRLKILVLRMLFRLLRNYWTEGKFPSDIMCIIQLLKDPDEGGNEVNDQKEDEKEEKKRR